MNQSTPGMEALSVSELISVRDAVSPQMRVEAVVDQFFNGRKLEALALVEAGRVHGLALRGKVFATLFSRRFGLELYARSPIIEIAETEPLIVKVTEPLDSILEKAMQRPAADIYDEVVVVDDDNSYLGLLSVKGMVLAQGDALSQSLIHRELALGRAMEMQKISEIKSEFIAHVTHDLRSPANVILGAAELMQMSLKEKNFAEMERHLNLLTIGSVNMRAIITNILDLSKIEPGKMEILPGPFEIRALLQEVADMTGVLLGGRPVEVKVVAEPAVFVADFVKIRQILLNLGSNAAKFTEQGSIEIRCTPADGGILLAVEDSGIGIHEEDLEKLFAPFTQVESAKTRQQQGTGLGLTITWKLVQILGGTISVQSSFGHGSTFSLFLPGNFTSQNHEASPC
ncbi:MAG: ATP-binding protein [Desulfuromonadales bacterium]|nr:ATP-binding protein [Desulfuromonadales bacterium]